MKKIFIIVIILIVVALVATMLWRVNPEQKTLVLPTSDTEIKQYAMSAEIVSLEGASLNVRVSMLFTDKDGRQSYDFKYIKVLVLDSTEINKSSDSSAVVKLSDLKAGDRVSIYTRQSPYTSDEVTAHQITVE